MQRTCFVIAVLVILTCGGCYRATIDLETTPSTVTIEKSFAASWIYGLVPPKTVTTASKCPQGVAKVETKLSFVNQLVGFLTLGIYTPMHITVTCAQGGSAEGPTPQPTILVAEGAGDEEVIEAFQAAADQAVSQGAAVFVGF